MCLPAGRQFNGFREFLNGLKKGSIRSLDWLNVAFWNNFAQCLSTYVRFIYNTYIRNWPLQPFSQDYRPLTLCVLNFIHKWRDLQFKVDSERQIFWETFHVNFFFTLRVFARNLLRGNRRRNTFRISFWCLTWDSNPGFSSNKPTHYLLDHGDYIHNFRKILESNHTNKRRQSKYTTF